VLGWYGLCASSAVTPSLTSASFNTGQPVVSSSVAAGSSTTYHDDDADLPLATADRPLDLTCNAAAAASRQCSLLTSS